MRKVEKHTIRLSKCSHPSYPSTREKDRALYHTVPKVKRALFGYSYAPAFVRSEMQQRFDDFFPEDGGSARSSSLRQSLLQEDEHEITEEKVEKALRDHLAGKPDKFVQNHLSLLQRNLEEVEQKEEALLGCLFCIFRMPDFQK